MLAVLHGAYLLTPEYVTDSIAAGRWLDEDKYLADVVFQAGAEKAREFLSGTSPSQSTSLLHGKKVAIYNGKLFNPVEIKPEMVGMYTGEFSMSYRYVS